MDPYSFSATRPCESQVMIRILMSGKAFEEACLHD
jgi:hypothetical protein